MTSLETISEVLSTQKNDNENLLSFQRNTKEKVLDQSLGIKLKQIKTYWFRTHTAYLICIVEDFFSSVKFVHS